MANPLVKIARCAAADMVHFAGGFGRTPRARSYLSAAGRTSGPGKFGPDQKSDCRLRKWDACIPFYRNTSIKTYKFLVRNCCARKSSTMVFLNMSNPSNFGCIERTHVAIQKLRHPITRAPVYLPEGQGLPDSAKTLESDGLIWCQYDEHGNCVSTLVCDPLSIRVLCWQLTVIAEAQHLGSKPVFTNLLADLCENFPGRVRHDAARTQLPQRGALRQRAEQVRRLLAVKDQQR